MPGMQLCGLLSVPPPPPPVPKPNPRRGLEGEWLSVCRGLGMTGAGAGEKEDKG
jgi:hypothetical protein